MKKLLFVLALVAGVSAANAQNRTSLKVADLPKAISENIAAEHKGYTVQDAYKIDTKGIISYEVLVKSAASRVVLLYDKDGKYVKMEPQANAGETPSKSTATASAGHNASAGHPAATGKSTSSHAVKK
jgi:hypothetical protein